MKRNTVERTNKAEIRSEEQSEKVEAYHQVPSTKKKKQEKSLGQPENMSHFRCCLFLLSWELCTCVVTCTRVRHAFFSYLVYQTKMSLVQTRVQYAFLSQSVYQTIGQMYTNPTKLQAFLSVRGRHAFLSQSVYQTIGLMYTSPTKLQASLFVRVRHTFLFQSVYQTIG